MEVLTSAPSPDGANWHALILTPPRSHNHYAEVLGKTVAVDPVAVPILPKMLRRVLANADDPCQKYPGEAMLPLTTLAEGWRIVSKTFHTETH
jgi:hypothetical protein